MFMPLDSTARRSFDYSTVKVLQKSSNNWHFSNRYSYIIVFTVNFIEHTLMSFTNCKLRVFLCYASQCN